jgi:hypothetical protein
MTCTHLFAHFLVSFPVCHQLHYARSLRAVGFRKAHYEKVARAFVCHSLGPLLYHGLTRYFASECWRFSVLNFFCLIQCFLFFLVFGFICGGSMSSSR